MIISLTGFMGCGKSSVGRRLSELLCCRFMDLDDVVEEVAGKNISEIFTKDGEGAFRVLELESLKNILCDSSRGKEIPMPPVCASRIHPLAGGGMSSTSHLPHASANQTADILSCQFRPIDLPDSETWASDRTSESTYEEGAAAVLALGGGTVMTPECAELVKENTLCIYLKASIDTLVKHLSSEAAKRPLLTATDKSLHSRIEELMSQRTSTYEKTANIIIDTDGKSIEQICSEITNLI